MKIRGHIRLGLVVIMETKCSTALFRKNSANSF